MCCFFLSFWSAWEPVENFCVMPLLLCKQEKSPETKGENQVSQKAPSGGVSSNCSAQSRVRVCSEPRPVGFWIFLGNPTLSWDNLFQCLTTTLIVRAFFFIAIQIFFCVLICASCLLFSNRAPSRKIWLRFLCAFPSGVIQSSKITPPTAFSSPGWIGPDLASSPCTTRYAAPNLLGGLCCTCSSMSVSVFYCGTQNWTQHFRCGLTSAE